ncbi:putative reverse transcriptase domain-containing protein [Tanacetum coccineum]
MYNSDPSLVQIALPSSNFPPLLMNHHATFEIGQLCDRIVMTLRLRIQTFQLFLLPVNHSSAAPVVETTLVRLLTQSPNWIGGWISLFFRIPIRFNLTKPLMRGSVLIWFCRRRASMQISTHLSSSSEFLLLVVHLTTAQHARGNRRRTLFYSDPGKDRLEVRQPIVEEEIVEPDGEDSSDSSATKDGIVRLFEDMPIDLDDVVCDFYHHMSEVRIDRIVEIETVQRRLEADQLIARGQRVSMIERIDNLRLENLKEEFRSVRDDGDGNKNRNVNGRDDRPVARECTYQDFMKCQPLSFKGTEGVWNSHNRTIRTDAAYALSWGELLKLLTEVYCPSNEIQKMETELWNLSVKNNDMTTYTQRFQELTMMCTKMVLEEEDQVEKFIGGLPDNIQGNVIAAEPTKTIRCCSNCQHLDGSKVEGLCCKKRREQEEIEQQL